MKEFIEQHKNILIIGGIAIVLFVALMSFLLKGEVGTLLTSNRNNITSVEAKNSKTGDKLTVHSDGRVEVRKGSDIFSGYWNKGKLDAFFDYYQSAYGESATSLNGSINFSYDDDELIDTIIDETSGGGDDGGGQNIDDLFDTPTPAPTGQGGKGNPTPTPSSPEEEPWCLYWRLSYCVVAYTPPPTGTPGPEEGILPPECGENLQTGRTVIGNELCVPEPSSTP